MSRAATLVVPNRLGRTRLLRLQTHSRHFRRVANELARVFAFGHLRVRFKARIAFAPVAAVLVHTFAILAEIFVFRTFIDIFASIYHWCSRRLDDSSPHSSWTMA